MLSIKNVKIKLFARNFGMGIGALLIGGGIMYGIMRYQQSQTGASSVLAAQKEAATVVEQVGKLIELPKETPTVATVSDVSKLKTQQFFNGAQNGDKVLIYVQAKEAILYRPSSNKIVKVAPLNIQNSPTPQKNATPSTSSVPTPTPVVIINKKPTNTPITPTQALTPQ